MGCKKKRKEKKERNLTPNCQKCHTVTFFVFDMESWIESVADYRGLIPNSQMTVSSEASAEALLHLLCLAFALFGASLPVFLPLGSVTMLLKSSFDLPIRIRHLHKFLYLFLIVARSVKAILVEFSLCPHMWTDVLRWRWHTMDGYYLLKRKWDRRVWHLKHLEKKSLADNSSSLFFLS